MFPIRHVVIGLLNLVEEGPGAIRRDPLDSQLQDLRYWAQRKSSENYFAAASFSDAAISAFIKEYRHQGWFVRRGFAPCGSSNSWVEYPFLYLRRTPFSLLSNALNVYARFVWYIWYLCFGLFCNTGLLVIFGGLVLAILLSVTGAFTLIGGLALTWLFGLVGISLGIVPFIFSGAVGATAVGIGFCRSW